MVRDVCTRRYFSFFGTIWDAVDGCCIHGVFEPTFWWNHIKRVFLGLKHAAILGRFTVPVQLPCVIRRNVEGVLCKLSLCLFITSIAVLVTWAESRHACYATEQKAHEVLKALATVCCVAVVAHHRSPVFEAWVPSRFWGFLFQTLVPILLPERTYSYEILVFQLSFFVLAIRDRRQTRHFTPRLEDQRGVMLICTLFPPTILRT